MTPRRVRVRLAALFGALFVASGAVLLSITYLLVGHSVRTLGFVHKPASGPQPRLNVQSGPGSPTPPGFDAMTQQLQEQATRLHAAQMHNLLVQSGVAMAIMAVISVVLSWVLAGRVLRPMRAVTAGIRRISANNVHERLAVQGPADEIKDLADSVDGLLGRLETALESHKRFVTNAAHELRTPLTVERALLEESLLDSDATAASFRENFQRLLKISTQQAALLESLLTLAVSERGVERAEPLDLTEIVRSVLLTPQPDARRNEVRIENGTPATTAAPVSGDTVLLERLVANLVQNAAYYNVEGGHVDVAVAVRSEGGPGRALLTVSNTGPEVPPDRVDQLFEPFQRLRRTAGDGHHGLGLSIVRAIATAHDATLAARARPGGGLIVEISFPLRVKPGNRTGSWSPTRSVAPASK
ncbi:sensor histidine kinase [Streptomyces sp. NPDC058457]|uniref:sensor histidine kinase n=1 Tax=Streptomyces sp. NPDC058457 TaxID=3346507 RepID=UPI0036690FB3